MKCGLKTFPLSVDLDDGVKLVEAEFGLKGYAVVIKLYQAIYSRGYYMKWDIDTQLLFMRDYCLVEVGRSLLSEIVACCVRRGVFESTLFDKYQILTSKRIQETFLTATKRSSQVVFEKEYALPIVYTFIENANKSGKTVNISFKNADSMYAKSDKGKERKEKESKGNIPPSARDAREEESPLPENVDDEKAINPGLRDFLKKYKNIVVDNCSNSNLSMMDYDLLDFRFAESEYLSENIHDLSWVAKNYHRIIAGEYKTKPKQGTVRRTKQSEGGISAQIDRLLKKFEEEDKLNEIDES